MDHAPAERLLTTGWFVALLGGATGYGLTMMLGGASLAALVIGAVSFGVFGVLLGKGGVELSPPSDHHDDHHSASHEGHH